MYFSNFIKKERKIWHKRFTPSLIAGLAVALISFFFKMTIPNIVMITSLGASAAIITHKHIHRLTILRTVIAAYLLALIVGLFSLVLIHRYSFSFPWAALITVFLVTLLMYSFNVFHPPAVSASLSFLMFDTGFIETITIFFAVIVLLIIIKLLTYAFYYEHLEMHKFKQEFKKIEREEMKKWKKLVKS